METTNQKEFSVETADLNRNLQYFSGSILVYYQDVLKDIELSVCNLLIKGHTLLSVSKALGLTRERVRQIFHKSIKKIGDAHQQKLNELAALRDENAELNYHINILKKEYLSEQSLKNADHTMSQKRPLCDNAKRLLNTPVQFLQLPQRAKNVLSSARVSYFREIPLLSEEILINRKNCGMKTIYELKAYLHKYNLELGLSYDEIINRMAELNDEDISDDNLKYSTRVTMDEFAAFLSQGNKPTEDIVETKDLDTFQQSKKTKNLTLDDICGETGKTKKSKKKWSRVVKRILLKNKIDTLEKLLSLKPSEFMEFEGVGKTTLYYTRKAIESFGFVWSDVK